MLLQADILGGLLPACFGVLGLIFGPSLDTGTTRRMGPGYFPKLLSWILIALGGIIAAAGAKATARAETVSAIVWRPVALITVAVVVFGVLMDRAGLLLATGALVGTDLTSGRSRYTFGLPELADGIGFVTLAMGLFGIADILANLERAEMPRLTSAVGRLWPTPEEMRRSAPASLRGTALGSLLGVLPGGGAALASFAAWRAPSSRSCPGWRSSTSLTAGPRPP